MKKSQKGAGRKETGNITIDLGEAVDKKLRAAIGEARKDVGGPAKMAGYRPGMFGGYRPGGASGLSRPGFGRFGGRPAIGSNGGSFRPWYADRESRFGSKLGLGALGVHTEVKTWDMLTGAAIGVVGNRALVRVSPSIVSVKDPKVNAMVQNAIAFVVGVVPALVKQNSITIGVAVPGAVFLAGSMVDWALDAIGINRPSLAGSEGAPKQGVDAALAARQRLAEIQQRIQPRPAVAASPARAYAQVR